MSLPRKLANLVLATSLFAGACSPAVTSRRDAGPGPGPTPIVTPAPKLDRDQVREALFQRREVIFQRFLAYREARVYPVNNLAEGHAHVWLDASGNLCAAATLISADWGRAASERVALENNFVRMSDIQNGPLMDWMLTSGLTHHELVAIQVPSMNPDGSVTWEMPGVAPEVPDPRAAEIARLHEIYIDVERQLTSMWDENLELATDALMKRPDLARALIDGDTASAGKYGEPSHPSVAGGFAQSPPA